ncbi:MAG: hypothetical protein HOP21_10295 [Methylotenera sp.]|nr:hypothetical protein [Methylotenera sp.]
MKINWSECINVLQDWLKKALANSFESSGVELVKFDYDKSHEIAAVIVRKKDRYAVVHIWSAGTIDLILDDVVTNLETEVAFYFNFDSPEKISSILDECMLRLCEQ